MSAAEQMTLDSRNAASFEGDEFLYRPIPSLIPVSLAFVLISLVAGVWDVLLIIPFVGGTLAVMSLRQIRRSGGTLSGGWLACTSLSLQAIMFAGFAAMHAYSYATEVPDGYERVNFTSDISKKGFSNQYGRLGIHPDVQQLVGKKVMIKGYMYPTKQMRGLKSFVLCRDNGDCCFGGQPKPTDMILVKMTGDKTVDFHDNKVMVAVSGIFKAEPTVDETGLQPVYQLEGEFFGKAKTLY
jgi:hypothetical protein